MNLAYYPRLICLALACFFAIYALGSSVVALSAFRLIRFAAKHGPGRAADFLLIVRLLPSALAAWATLGVCVPSYALFEMELRDEPVGLLCLAMAICGGVILGSAITRTARVLWQSFLFVRFCRKAGYERRCGSGSPAALIVQTSAPCLALIGIVRPRVVVSDQILNALSEDELSMALGHESAHAKSWDNLKRLSFLIAPGSRGIEHAWMKFAEYAADQQAAHGDLNRSAALASALVKVARFGQVTQMPASIPSFLEHPSELALRVNRLLTGPLPPEPGSLIFWPILTAALVLSPAMFSPSMFKMAHAILERLL